MAVSCYYRFDDQRAGDPATRELRQLLSPMVVEKIARISVSATLVWFPAGFALAVPTAHLSQRSWGTYDVHDPVLLASVQEEIRKLLAHVKQPRIQWLQAAQDATARARGTCARKDKWYDCNQVSEVVAADLRASGYKARHCTGEAEVYETSEGEEQATWHSWIEIAGYTFDPKGWILMHSPSAKLWLYWNHNREIYED